jgi:hypothetical protein
MIPLQLAFATTQLGFVFISGLILFAGRSKKPKTALPIFVDEPLNSSHGHTDDVTKELAGEEKVDPFDVAKAIDFTDGIPLEEDQFWAWVCYFKFMSYACTLIFVAYRCVLESPSKPVSLAFWYA